MSAGRLGPLPCHVALHLQGSTCLSCSLPYWQRQKNTCFTPLNQTKWLRAPAKDIELKLTELKWSPPDLQNPLGLRSNAGTEQHGPNSINAKHCRGVLWQGLARGESLLWECYRLLLRWRRNIIGCNCCPLWNTCTSCFSLHQRLKFWYLLRSSVMEKGPLSVAVGLIHVCICTISEMLYQYIRTLCGIILCNWSSKCNVYSGLQCNLKVGIIKHILLMVFICLLIQLLLWKIHHTSFLLTSSKFHACLLVIQTFM